MGLVALLVFLLILAIILLKVMFRLTFNNGNLIFFGVLMLIAMIYLAVAGHIK